MRDKKLIDEELLEYCTERRREFINWAYTLPDDFSSLQVKDITEKLQYGDYIAIYILNSRECTFRALERDRSIFDRYMNMHCYIKYITLTDIKINDEYDNLIIVHLEVL